MGSDTNVSHHNGTCIDGGDDTTIRVHFLAGSSSVDFDWPPLPPAGKAYAFALSEAIAVLSPECAAASGLHPNADNGPNTLRNLWVGRLSEAPDIRMSECGCGTVVFLSGSGGMTGDNLRYCRHFAALGYSVLAPDTMAGERGVYPRSKPLVPHLSRALAAVETTYWCSDVVYAGGCDGAYQGGASPACFSSAAESVLHDPAAWAAFYERVNTMRQRELAAVLEGFVGRFGAAPRRLILAGASEGAMVASRAVHPLLLDGSLKLEGRVLLQWSCDNNYFVSCARHALLCEGACNASAAPVLSIISDRDEYFASNASIAAAVGSGAAGYGAWPLVGTCAATMRAQRMRGAAFEVREPYHGLMAQAGSFVRMALARFVEHPADSAAPIFAFDGVALDNRLCDDRTVAAAPAVDGSDGDGDGDGGGDGGSGSVFEAICSDLGDFLQPQPPDAFDSTLCAWPSEQLRPVFVGLTGAAERCADPAAAVGQLGVAAASWAGVSLGLGVALAFTCVALVRRIHKDLAATPPLLARRRLHSHSPSSQE